MLCQLAYSYRHYSGLGSVCSRSSNLLGQKKLSWPWRCRNCSVLKRRYRYTEKYSLTSSEVWFFINTVLRTSNPAFFKLFEFLGAISVGPLQTSSCVSQTEWSFLIIIFDWCTQRMMIPYRAMRNRGVEIYMLGPQEEEYNTLDLRSLLYHAGLRSVSQQDALLSVHQVMKQGEYVCDMASHQVSIAPIIEL